MQSLRDLPWRAAPTTAMHASAPYSRSDGTIAAHLPAEAAPTKVSLAECRVLQHCLSSVPCCHVGKLLRYLG